MTQSFHEQEHSRTGLGLGLNRQIRVAFAAWTEILREKQEISSILLRIPKKVAEFLTVAIRAKQTGHSELMALA